CSARSSARCRTPEARSLRRILLPGVEAPECLLSLEIVLRRGVLTRRALHAHVAHLGMKFGAAPDIALQLPAGSSALARCAAFFLHLPDQFVVGMWVAFGHRLSPFSDNGTGRTTVPSATLVRVRQASGRGAEAAHRRPLRLPAGRAERRLPRGSATLGAPASPWGEPG